MATSTEIGGVKHWPTTESFDRARRALIDAYNELENLTFGYRQLSGEYDPADVAAESVPVPADAIAAVVEFTEEAEMTAQEIATMEAEIAAWSGRMANVRMDQRAQDPLRAAKGGRDA